MAKNLMPEVAKLLGVEIGERFKVVNGKSETDAIITNDAFCDIGLNGNILPNSLLFQLVLKGEWIVQKLPWEPKEGDTYYCVNTIQKRVGAYQWIGFAGECVLKSLGMVYRTREEAEAHLAEDYEKITGKKLE